MSELVFIIRRNSLHGEHNRWVFLHSRKFFSFFVFFFNRFPCLNVSAANKRQQSSFWEISCDVNAHAKIALRGNRVPMRVQFAFLPREVGKCSCSHFTIYYTMSSHIKGNCLASAELSVLYITDNYAVGEC